MRTRKPLPPRLGDHFTVREAAAAKVSRRRLGADDLARPFHGIRSREEPCSFRDRVDCYRRRMRRGQRHTGRTALRIWGLPVPWPWRPDEPLDVAVDARDNPPRTRGVRGRRLAADAAVTWKVGGLAVVDPIAAVFTIATELTIVQAVTLLDALITDADDYPGLLRRPMATLVEIEARLAAWGRFRGVRTIRAALPYVRERVESPTESETRMLLIRAGLPEPVIQHEVALPDGRARLDLAYPDLRVAIEYEGDGHRTDKAQWRRDIVRQRPLEQCGWMVIRLTQLDLDQPEGLIGRIRALFRQGRRH